MNTITTRPKYYSCPFVEMTLEKFRECIAMIHQMRNIYMRAALHMVIMTAQPLEVILKLQKNDYQRKSSTLRLPDDTYIKLSPAICAYLDGYLQLCKRDDRDPMFASIRVGASGDKEIYLEDAAGIYAELNSISRASSTENRLGEDDILAIAEIYANVEDLLQIRI